MGWNPTIIFVLKLSEMDGWEDESETTISIFKKNAIFIFVAPRTSYFYL
jgi:hypothetical protein